MNFHPPKGLERRKRELVEDLDQGMERPAVVDTKGKNHVLVVDPDPVLRVGRCLYKGVCPSEDLPIYSRNSTVS
jgi:hypothetical protein